MKRPTLYEGITLAFALTAILISWCQNKKVNQITKLTESIRLEPLLKIVGIPEVKIIDAHINGRKLKDWADNAIVLKHGDSLYATMTIEEKYTIVNSSDFAATIKYSLFDYNSEQDEILRKNIENDIWHSSNYTEETSEELLFQGGDIPPHDTVYLSWESTLPYKPEFTKLITHRMFFYENDLGILYDIYCQSYYKLDPPLFETAAFPVSGDENVRAITYTVSYMDKNNLKPIQPKKVTYGNYSYKQKEHIDKKMKLMMNKIKSKQVK
jgi:hypothetical protein